MPAFEIPPALREMSREELGRFRHGELSTAEVAAWMERTCGLTAPNPPAQGASAVGAALMRRLELPALSRAYVDRNFAGWVPVDPEHGVYARNLAASRRAPGVVMMVEGPCMNDPAEYRRLQGSELEIDGRHYPAHLRPYAGREGRKSTFPGEHRNLP